MSRIGGGVTRMGKGFLGWLFRYMGWLFLTTLITLGGALVLMLFKDWTVKSLFTSMMAWPLLALGMVIAAPIALLRPGRVYFYTALGGGFLYNLVLLIS